MSCSDAALAKGLPVPRPVVINTRPIERAAVLTQHLATAGFDVVELPMLALQPCVITDTDRQLMQRWLAGDYQALVIVSPTAATLGLTMWHNIVHDRQADTAATVVTAATVTPIVSQPAGHIIAVGAATAAALCHSSVTLTEADIKQPAVSNNEGLLAMPEITQLRAGDRVLIWRGLGGRRLLVDALQARGVHIDSIAWYERTLPLAARQQYQQWHHQHMRAQYDHANSTYTNDDTANDATISAPKPIVIVSSGTAFEHWQSVVEQAALSAADAASRAADQTVMRLSDFAYVVLGARLAEMVAAQQLPYWRVEDLAPATIALALLRRACTYP